MATYFLGRTTPCLLAVASLHPEKGSTNLFSMHPPAPSVFPSMHPYSCSSAQARNIAHWSGMDLASCSAPPPPPPPGRGVVTPCMYSQPFKALRATACILQRACQLVISH